MLTITTTTALIIGPTVGYVIFQHGPEITDVTVSLFLCISNRFSENYDPNIMKSLNVILKDPVFYIANSTYNIPDTAQILDAGLRNIPRSERIAHGGVFTLPKAKFTVDDFDVLFVKNLSTIIGPKSILKDDILLMQNISFTMIDPIFIKYNGTENHVLSEGFIERSISYTQPLTLDNSSFITASDSNSLPTRPFGCSHQGQIQLTGRITEPVFIMDDLAFDIPKPDPGMVDDAPLIRKVRRVGLEF